MKYKLLSACLALGTIEVHSNFFGNKKPSARFDEEQLQAIESALEKQDTSELTSKIKGLEADFASLQSTATSIEEAVSAAFEHNGLTMEKGTSVMDAIASLSAKCKEYASSKNTHSLVANDGKEKKEEEKDPSAEYEHNKIYNKLKNSK